jgi:CheY-like chemotaxis protein
VVRSALEASRPFVEARLQELELSLPSEPSIVDGDPTRLSQVVLNLVNNAVRYTPERGRITVTLERLDDEAVLRVRDTGIGIPDRLLPKIFELFEQGERSLDRSEGGLGIGLTLVQRLVALHGGTVEAKSDGRGHGSEFIVRLPLHPPGHGEAMPRSTAEAPPALDHRILVVEDNRDSATSLAMLLRLRGHDVRIAHDGPEALDLAATFRPSVVLLDIGLPGMSGYEVAARLRQLPGGGRLVVVALTGYGREADRLRSAAARFDHHLVKPVKLEVLEPILGDAGSATADLSCRPEGI